MKRMRWMRACAVFLAAALTALLTVGCSEERAQPTLVPRPEMGEAAQDLIQNLVGEKYDLVVKQFDDQLKGALTEEGLKTAWEPIAASSGAYEGVADTPGAVVEGDYVVYRITCNFENNGVLFTISFTADSFVGGLYMKPVDRFDPNDDDVANTTGRPAADLWSEDVVLDKDGKYPLPGKLTLPKDASPPYPAVVLVQGSGPSDMDETVYGNKPFLDIAEGLTMRGVAVLRYDKRTYAHADKLTADLNRFTVMDETMADALIALRMLQRDDRIDSRRIYLVGHSLGAMMAPRIDDLAGDTGFSGIVYLAGSPRTLTEILYDQNLYLLEINNTGEEQKQELLTAINAERDKAEQLGEMSAEDAQRALIYQMPAYYFKEMNDHPTEDYLKNNKKPMFFLQGTADFQITVEKDFEAYRAIVGDRENVTMKTYEGLNHLFMQTSAKEGEKPGLSDYKQEGYVDRRVIADIAGWVLAQS